MIIEFSNKIPLKYQKEIRQAIEFYCGKTFHSRIRKTLFFNVERLNKSDPNWGLLEWENEYLHPREFTLSLNIDNRMIGDIIKTVMHEMVHVQQFISGRLKHRFYPRKKILWENKEVDTQVVPYYDLPWEIDAYSKELDLFLSFTQHRWNS